MLPSGIWPLIFMKHKLCSVCEAKIEEERLEALPGTTICMECAKRAPQALKVVPVASSSQSARNGFYKENDQ